MHKLHSHRSLGEGRALFASLLCLPLLYRFSDFLHCQLALRMRHGCHWPLAIVNELGGRREVGRLVRCKICECDLHLRPLRSTVPRAAAGGGGWGGASSGKRLTKFTPLMRLSPANVAANATTNRANGTADRKCWAHMQMKLNYGIVAGPFLNPL